MSPQPPSGSPPRARSYKYYDFVMAAFVTVLLCSNLIGVGKVCEYGGFTFGAGTFFFPISYIFGDVLTEVYGYARTRKVVWTGFAALAFASFMSWAVIHMRPSPAYLDQGALEAIFSSTPRIVGASLIAYWAGELFNSYVLAKMKVWTEGRHLWARTIGSTLVGQVVDSAIFYPIAFLGSWPTDIVVKVTISNFVLKVLWEAIATPITYAVVNFLKKAEHEDYYDRETDFTPFSLDT